MAKKKVKGYTSITIRKDAAKAMQFLKCKLDAKSSTMNFFEELLDAYDKTHCPECLCEVKTKRCTCKASELL
jgi:hypothetical protein